MILTFFLAHKFINVMAFMFMQNDFLEVSIGIFILLTLLFFLPIKGNFKLKSEIPTTRINERNIMLSRNEITGRPALQRQYYKDFPEHKALDKIWQERAGLGSKDSQFYAPLSFKASEASFHVIDFLRPIVNGPLDPIPEDISAEKLTKFILKWTKKLGAVSVGICDLKDYHLYTERGRGEAYGEKVENHHHFAIVFTVEMDEEYLSTGPAGPTLMESASQYLNSGVISLQIAEFLRRMGFESRAHIDSDYELIAPLVARDAGLGELGRMGLLMTPELGPRVRIGVVSTGAPLIISERKPDYTVHEFCNLCKKCAVICPSQAIPKTPIEEMDGVERWKINQEKCFGYWCTSGTDCGRCMSVCPYAHKNNWLHNFVRWGIKNNVFFRHAAVYLDDIFYGKKPKPKEVPDWLKG